MNKTTENAQDQVLTEADEIEARRVLAEAPADTSLFNQRREPSVDQKLSKALASLGNELAESFPFDNKGQGVKYDADTNRNPKSGFVPQPYGGQPWVVDPQLDPTQVQVVQVNQPIGSDQTQQVTPKDAAEQPISQADPIVPRDYSFDRVEDEDDISYRDLDRLTEQLPLYTNQPLRTEITARLILELTDLRRCRRLLDDANYDKVFADVVDCILTRNDAIKAAATYRPSIFVALPISNMRLIGLINSLEKRLKKFGVALPEGLDKYRNTL